MTTPGQIPPECPTCGKRQWPVIHSCKGVAPAARPAEPRGELRCAAEHCDRGCEDVIRERDEVEDIADRLAYAIAPVGVIGEHSSANNPWQNALDLVSEAGSLAAMQAKLQYVERLADVWESGRPGPMIRENVVKALRRALDA